MEDKKTNVPSGDNKPETAVKTEPAVKVEIASKPEEVKKEEIKKPTATVTLGGDKSITIDLSKGFNIEDLKKAAQENKQEFGSAGQDNINKNLGSFGNTVVKPAEVKPNEIKLDVDDKVVEKAAKEKINFERFSKTKKTEKSAKTKFGEKVSIMLRSKKGLTTTWIIEMLVLAFTVACGVALICLFARWWSGAPEGPMNETLGTLRVGYIFVWISVFPCAIPLIYLLTSWFIGINQVASSRLYHFIFWGFAAFGLLCLIIGFALLCPSLAAWVQFPGYY